MLMILTCDFKLTAFVIWPHFI